MSILFLLFGLFCTTKGQISHVPGETCANAQSTSKVVGGVDLRAEQIPWNVVIEKKVKENKKNIISQCGGNIISQTAILTAAHCVWLNKLGCPENVRNQETANECHQLEGGCPDDCIRARPQDLNIYAGITNITQADRMSQTIERIILHPLWDKSSSDKESIKKGHDLSILILKNKLELSPRIRPICLPDLQLLLRSGQNVVVTGFGYTNAITRTPANRLQGGQLQMITKDQCNTEYDALSKKIIQGDQLCAYADGTDSCSGDSGGGLFKFEGSFPVLVGIVSFGTEYCRNYPGVYTNVQTHVDWILQQLREFPQNSGRCSEEETCETKQTCSYIQRKYKEALETESKEKKRSIINMLKSIICNKDQRAFCCPRN